MSAPFTVLNSALSAGNSLHRLQGVARPRDLSSNTLWLQYTRHGLQQIDLLAMRTHLISSVYS